MNGPTGPDTFWLDFVNAALGLVTLLCLLLVGSGIVRELFHRVVRRADHEHASRAPSRA